MPKTYIVFMNQETGHPDFGFPEPLGIDELGRRLIMSNGGPVKVPTQNIICTTDTEERAEMLAQAVLLYIVKSA